MKILHLSDFDLKGSGYQAIAANLCTNLYHKGHEVAVLGFEYKGEEHNYPFSVIPATLDIIASQASQIIKEWSPDIVMASFDLGYHEKAIELVKGGDKAIYIGIFAVEGAPMVTPSAWAATIKRMDVAYSISQFGADTCNEVGLACKHLPIGIDTSFWKPLESGERKQIRDTLGIDDKFVVITVADNHERKNHPCGIEAVSLLKKSHPDIYYILVTKERPGSIGWNLWYEAKKFGIERDIFILDQGCTIKKLKEFYGVSDAFLLTSKAEGLGIPLLEAMACGVPCVASQTCSIPSILDGRGLTIEPEYEYTDPFGNTRRQFVSPQHAGKQLLRLVQDKRLYNRLKKNSLEYTAGLTWDNTVKVLEEDANVKIKEKQEVPAEVPPNTPTEQGEGTPENW